MHLDDAEVARQQHTVVGVDEVWCAVGVDGDGGVVEQVGGVWGDVAGAGAAVAVAHKDRADPHRDPGPGLDVASAGNDLDGATDGGRHERVAAHGADGVVAQAEGHAIGGVFAAADKYGGHRERLLGPGGPIGGQADVGGHDLQGQQTRDDLTFTLSFAFALCAAVTCAVVGARQWCAAVTAPKGHGHATEQAKRNQEGPETHAAPRRDASSYPSARY